MTLPRRIFLKQAGLAAVGASLLTSYTQDLFAFRDVKISLPRSTPEQQGISSQTLLALLDAMQQSNIEFHSLMIIRHGQVVAEGWWSPYAAPLKHTLHSLSKSVTATAVGLAAAEGRFTLDAPVISFFPKELPAEVTPNLSAMTVKHLLMMGTGHGKDTMPALRAPGNTEWVKTFLAQPVEFEPGSKFVYNTGATYVQSGIVQKTTGKTLQEYLKPRLFDPLGIDDFDWEWSPEGINTGGYGLRLRTEDIGKFGQMYLNNGKFNSVQIVPAAFIADATTSHIDSGWNRKGPRETDDWSQGYGYQFWRCTHNAYRADGAFGQFCIIMPDQDTIVVITEESFKTQVSLGLIWNVLFPALKESALPADPASYKKLQERLKSLSLKPDMISDSSPMAEKISGKEFVMEENEFKTKSISLAIGSDSCSFTVKDETGKHSIKCGIGKWLREENFRTQSIFPLQGRAEVSTPVCASATWSDPGTLMMTWRYPATAYSDYVLCEFAEDKVTVKFMNSITKGNPSSAEKRQDMHGKMTV